MLGVVYSLIIPAWEGVDEDGHFAYARYVVRHGALPRPGDPEAEKIRENFQPPLYYLLVAPVIAGLDLGETWIDPARNPYFTYGNAGYNFALHPDHLEGTAQSISRAVHVARLVSVVVTTASVIAVYAVACRVWPGEPKAAWAAAGLYAFWPQFLFLGSIVSNDALIIALSALFFYLAIRLTMEGFSLGLALGLACVLGGALLTKLNALALIPTAALALYLSLARGRWKPSHILSGMAVLGLTLVAAMWLLNSLEFVKTHVWQTQTVTNFLNYADPALTHLSLGRFLAISFRHGFRSFLAAFGWGNLVPFQALYWAWTLGAGLALGGLSSALVKREASRPLKVLLLALCQFASPVLLALALAIAYRNAYLVLGRYLLPGLPAVAILLVWGWRTLLPERWRVHCWKAVCLGAVLVGWSIPVTTLLPAYAKPRPLPANFAADHPLAFFFGDDIELIGYQNPPAVIPRREFRLSLCWRAVRPVRQNYSVFLELAGSDGRRYGQLETYPGRGNYATTLWPAQTPFCDEYTLRVGPHLAAFSEASVRVSLLDGVRGEKLPVKNPAGEVVGREVQIPLVVQNNE